MRLLSLCIVGGVSLALAACGTSVETGRTGSIGGYKVGKPYQINGVWYYPAEDFAYDETGIASWYGRDFHGRSTANGESYDMDAETAAHKTLPMPSMVEVTNLENGRRIRVRINDRGPFVAGRIIDLSRRSAELLGMDRQGTARVRVRILPEESLAMKTQAIGGGTVELAAAAPRTPVEQAELAPPAPPEAVSPPPAPAPAPASPLPVVAASVPVEAEPEVTLVPVHPTSIYVQAGAFAQPDNAQRLRAELARLGPTEVVGVEVFGRRFYRVRVGPVRSVEDGDRVLAQVVAAGHDGARLVVD